MTRERGEAGGEMGTPWNKATLHENESLKSMEDAWETPHQFYTTWIMKASTKLTLVETIWCIHANSNVQPHSHTDPWNVTAGNVNMG